MERPAGSIPAVHTSPGSVSAPALDAMPNEFSYSWIVLAEARDLTFSVPTDSTTLRLKTNPGFVKNLGIRDARAVYPFLIEPSIEVWQEVVRSATKYTGLAISGKSPVLRISNPGGSDIRIAFVVKFFRPNIFALNVSLLDDATLQDRDAFDRRDLRRHSGIYHLVDSLVGILRSGDFRTYERNNHLSVKPAMFLKADTRGIDFVTWLDTNKSVIANLLINNRFAEYSNPELTEQLIRKNLEHNVKTERAGLTLIDKQGLLTVASAADFAACAHLWSEHQKKLRLFELSYVLQRFLSGISGHRTKKEDAADFLLYLVAPSISEPQSFFAKSVTNFQSWLVLMSEFDLARAFKSIPAVKDGSAPAKDQYFAKIPAPSFYESGIEQKIRTALKRYRKSRFEVFYLQHQFLAWVITTLVALLAAVGTVAEIFRQ